jgi:Resolvase, N terminal domain
VNSSGDGALTGTLCGVTLKIGYARVSTDDQDLTAQRDALAALGVAPDRVYVDHGLTGTNRDRPGLRESRPRLGSLRVGLHRNTRCGGYGSELRCRGPRDGP